MKVLKTFLVAKDSRGIIIRLIDFARIHKFRSALFIKSNKGAIRANHYHKNDIHFTCLISGKFKYFEKGLSDRSRTRSRFINPGEIVISYPKTIHEDKNYVNNARSGNRQNIFHSLLMKTCKSLHNRISKIPSKYYQIIRRMIN